VKRIREYTTLAEWSHNGEPLFFDIESHNIGPKQWYMKPREFGRLYQYAWGRDGEVVLTTDYDEMIAQLRGARLIIGHNIHSFDLSVLFGVDSTEPLQMALDQRILDTFTWASVVMPAPDVWTDESGVKMYTFRNGKADVGVSMKWLGLNNLNTQLGIPTKTAHLQDLAKKYNPPKTKIKGLDYGLIPLDDPEFLEYAAQDVVAVRELAISLLAIPGGVTPYVWREQKFAAICAQNTRNGWTVDVPLAEARVAELQAKRDQIMDTVVSKYGLPTEGAMPWRTKEGKAAIFAALYDYGISPDTRADWPLTETGNPSLGGEALIGLTRGTPAEDLGVALAEIMGQRPLAKQALEYVQADGRVHPDITYLQRSGRLSTTKPGLTTWTSRGPGAIEKQYFTRSGSDRKLVSFDFSNADARAVAGYSGDTEYLKRFDPDVDAHELTARLVWGDEVYEASMLPGWETDDEIRKKNPLRHTAKMLTHAYSYGARPKTLMVNSAGQGYPTPDGKPIDLETTTRFCQVMDDTYAGVVAWQRSASKQGDHGYIVNDWGRKMIVTKGRSFTQSSALLGQSATREVLVDGLIKLAEVDLRFITYLRAQVHDEIILEIPIKTLDKDIDTVVRCLSRWWKPQHGGQRVEFTLSHGEPSDDWYQAGH
jgi:DNA polymerase-1